MIWAKGLIAGNGRGRARSSDRRQDRGSPAQWLPAGARQGHSPSPRGQSPAAPQPQPPAAGVSPGCARRHCRSCASRYSRPGCHRRRCLPRTHRAGGPATADPASSSDEHARRPENRAAVSASRLAGPSVDRSGRQALAPLSAAAIDDPAAVLGRHPRAKTMTRLADPDRGLECSLHGVFSRADRPALCKGANLRRLGEFHRKRCAYPALPLPSIMSLADLLASRPYRREARRECLARLFSAA